MARTSRRDPDALDQILRQQMDVIARHQALAAGVTASALRHRLRPGGPWRTLLPGVYIAATGTPTTLQQEMAALLYAGSGSVITGPAALRCHHIRGTSSELVDVLVPATRQRRDAAFVRLHRTTRMPGRIWQAGPLRYAPPAARRRRCRARHDQPAGRAGGRGRRGAAGPLRGAGPLRRTHRRAERRVGLVPRGPDGCRRRDQVDRRRRTSRTCWSSPGCRCRCSTRRCTTATPSSPSPTPGGPSSAWRSRWIRANGTCRPRITRRRSPGAADGRSTR